MASQSRAARRFVWRAAGTVLAVVFATGCSGSGDEKRVEFKGSVSYRGRPLVRGTVSVLPAEGQSGAATMVVIEQGRFHFQKSDGPVPGPCRIVVLVNPEDWEAMVVPEDQRSMEPEPVTKRWEFRVDVPEESPFQHDLELD